MQRGEYRNVLFLATGALMSPTACQQGESIPGVAHLLHLTAEGASKGLNSFITSNGSFFTIIL